MAISVGCQAASRSTPGSPHLKTAPTCLFRKRLNDGFADKNIPVSFLTGRRQQPNSWRPSTVLRKKTVVNHTLKFVVKTTGPYRQGKQDLYFVCKTILQPRVTIPSPLRKKKSKKGVSKCGYPGKIVLPLGMYTFFQVRYKKLYRPREKRWRQPQIHSLNSAVLPPIPFSFQSPAFLFFLNFL